MQFAEGSLNESLEDISRLILNHFNEVTFYPDIHLRPDFDRYIKLEELGAFKLFTAHNDHELCGYAGFFISPSLHQMQSIQAVQDLIYLKKECRGGTGREFIDFCDTTLRSMGVDVVYHHVKEKHNWSNMLVRAGYELQDLVYSKRLN